MQLEIRSGVSSPLTLLRLPVSPVGVSQRMELHTKKNVVILKVKVTLIIPDNKFILIAISTLTRIKCLPYVELKYSEMFAVCGA